MKSPLAHPHATPRGDRLPSLADVARGLDIQAQLDKSITAQRPSLQSEFYRPFRLMAPLCRNWPPWLRCGRANDRRIAGARRGNDHRLCPWAAGHAAELGHLRAGKTNAATGEVLSLFRDWLEERCRELRPRWIAFEAPYVPQVTPARVRSASGQAVWTMPSRRTPINIHTLRRLISLCGLVEMVAHQHRIECREELPTKITQSFTGHGNWAGRENKKKATIRMCEVYGWPVANDDEADALALWVYAEAVLYPQAAQRRGAGPLFGRAVS